MTLYSLVRSGKRIIICEKTKELVIAKDLRSFCLLELAANCNFIILKAKFQEVSHQSLPLMYIPAFFLIKGI